MKTRWLVSVLVSCFVTCLVTGNWLTGPGLAAGAEGTQPVTLPPPAAAREYSARRENVRESLEGSPEETRVLLLRSPPLMRFSGDVHYPYRTNSDLYYLGGIAEEGTALLLSGRKIPGLGREVLFLREPSHLEGRWISRRLTPEQASARSGIPREHILPLKRLPEVLRKALGRDRVRDQDRGTPAARVYLNDVGEKRHTALLTRLGRGADDLDIRPAWKLVVPLRQVKSPAEIRLIKKAIDATCEAHRLALRLVRPGLTENQVAAAVEGEFRNQGASGWSFPSIVGSGPNTCILHYDRYDRRIASGDLVLMDIGAEYGFYAADITRTIPASGRFTPRQKEVYRIVFDAQEAAFAVIRPGIEHREVHEAARDVVAAGLVRLGLIRNPSRVRKYLPHGTSHGLGLDVHDPMPTSTLAAGMVITVEPGIYIPEENLGIRIEDDVLVTDDGCEVLSTRAPRKLEELERWMRSRSF